MGRRNETFTVKDAVTDVATRKQRAARARTAGASPDAEAPRDVYLAACEAIAAAFAQDGFKYAKSGPHMRRRTGDFIFHVRFQSSFHNVPGEHVSLKLHANVLSRRLKNWRSEQPNIHETDVIAGGQIGNLVADYRWIDWELADRDERESRIADAIEALEQYAIPYFRMFEDLPTLIQRLTTTDIPSWGIRNVVEFLMCFADAETARTAARNYLQRNESVISPYNRDFDKGPDAARAWSRASAFAQQLAFVSHMFQFGRLTEQAD